MKEVHVETEEQRAVVIDRLKLVKLPFTMSIGSGKHRTLEQNRLQRMWCNEVADYLQDDQTPEDIRGWCKLHLGIPILRRDSAKYKAIYDEDIRPLPYPLKIKLMMVPHDYPVTRLMNSKQKSEYLDMMFKHWTEFGVTLTQPPEKS